MARSGVIGMPIPERFRSTSTRADTEQVKIETATCDNAARGSRRRASQRLVVYGGVLVALSVMSLGCGEQEAAMGERFAAQCLGIDDSGGLLPDPVVCRLDSQGLIVSVSDIELGRGLPFVVHETSGRVLAISRSGDVIDVSEETIEVVSPADAMSAYGLTTDSELVEMTRAGELRVADEVLQAFSVDGNIDVTSGVDIIGTRIAFTAEKPAGAFAIVVGDMSTGGIHEVFVWNEYVGSARWSPDGTKLSFVGPDYRSIVVTDTDGVIHTVLSSEDTRLSGRVAGPRWIDDDTIVYYDSATALLEATVSTGRVEVIALHPIEAGQDLVPVLPVPLPG